MLLLSTPGKGWSCWPRGTRPGWRELRAALVKIDEKHADPVPLENYGDALHEFDFDSDKRLSIYEWRYVPWPRRAYHSDEGHERG